MDETKACLVCGLSKPLDDFYAAAGCVDGRRGDCKACFQAKAKARRDANPELLEAARRRTARWIEQNRDRYDAYKAEYRTSDNHKRAWRRWYLKDKYGITPERYDAMLERQGGLCAICEQPPQKTLLHVDHDHDTGRVRGLLCFSCNVALGYLKHDLDRLASAMTYLGAHRRYEALRQTAVDPHDDGGGGRER